MLKLLRGAELSQEIALYKSGLSAAERQIIAAMPAGAADFDTQFDSDLDAGDIAYSLAIGLVGVFISANADFEKWLASVHDAASGKKGNMTSSSKCLGPCSSIRVMRWMCLRAEKVLLRGTARRLT